MAMKPSELMKVYGPVPSRRLGPSLEDVFLRLTGVEMEAEIIHKRKGRREAR